MNKINNESEKLERLKSYVHQLAIEHDGYFNATLFLASEVERLRKECAEWKSLANNQYRQGY